MAILAKNFAEIAEFYKYDKIMPKQKKVVFQGAPS